MLFEKRMRHETILSRFSDAFTLARGVREWSPLSGSSGAGLVEVDGNLVGHRVALARQNEPARDFVILEREVHVHVDFAFEQLAAARRAHAALARVRQLEIGRAS